MRNTRFRFLKITALVLFFAALIIMCSIFMFSSQPASESDAVSYRIAYFIAPRIIPHYDEMSSEAQISVCRTINHYARKTAHFLEYCLLNCILTVAVYCLYLKHKSFYIWLPLVISIIFACSDEIHQIFVNGRGPGIRDVIIDSLGALAGFGFSVLFLRLCQHLFEKWEVRKTNQNSKGE